MDSKEEIIGANNGEADSVDNEFEEEVISEESSEESDGESSEESTESKGNRIISKKGIVVFIEKN